MSTDIPGWRELASQPLSILDIPFQCPFRLFLLISIKFTVSCVYLEYPPLIGNYDVKRCFELDSIFHYQIPGGLTINTIRNITEEFYSFFLILYNPYLSIQQCSEVSLTIGNITSSPPGVSNVYFRVPFTYTASNDIADDQVASNVTTCINAANFTLKGYIDRNAPNITQNNGTHQINQPSFLEKRSCCGGDILPPCCTVGSKRVSSTKCGKTVSFFALFLCLPFFLG